eukprot:TRINITY_DN1588_c0_g1_i1.p1 TRINITY_DN1588_c0_g1~~TRINITY_DN1588_c0_g1_i1.p1  ORF type:complete len:226 (+),score=68.98 TRINITY_DN1588_c0_g1_i1:129-806(+)
MDNNKESLTDIKKKNKVKRLKQRANYDEKTIYSILDSAYVAHVGFVQLDEENEPEPVVIPMIYGRHENKIYLHGSASTRIMKDLANGAPICVSVTHLDALVLARSIFHHSVNYRSAVLFGNGKLVEGEEKTKGMFYISENMLKGRWDDSRVPNESEMKATKVIEMTIDLASAKVREGPPKDDENDIKELDYWSGLVPMKVTYGEPIDDPTLKSGIKPPKYLDNLK